MHGDPSNHAALTRRLIVAGGLALIALLLAVSLFSFLRLPYGIDARDIISFSTLMRENPANDYVRYALLVGLGTLGALLGVGLASRPTPRLLAKAWRFTKLHLRDARLHLSLVLLIGLTWTINVSYFDLGGQLGDAFHEGEFIGFLPAFLQSATPFLDTFFIHGFGINALPSLAGHLLAPPGHVIAVARAVRWLQAAGAWLGTFWVIWEIVAAYRGKASRTLPFAIASLAVCLLLPIYYINSLVILIQLALVIHILRKSRECNLSAFQAAWLSLLVGALVPISVLYSYDRAAYFGPLYVAVTALLFFHDRRHFGWWLGGTMGGGVIAAGGLLAILGWEQLTHILTQILYWSKNGSDIWALPLSNSIASSLYMLLPVLIQVGALTYLILMGKRHARDWRGFLSQNALMLVLLLASILFMRDALARSDSGHILRASLPTLFLLIALSLAVFKEHPTEGKKLTGAFIAILLIGGLSQGTLSAFDPLLAVRRLGHHAERIRYADSQIIQPSHLAAADAVRSEVERTSTFFTLTSEGTWYYLFNKPSPSPFHQVLYARTKEAQHRLVQDFEQNPPNVVLLTNDFWSNEIDGVTVPNSNPIVYQYVIKHYRPFRLEHGQWFWKRATTPATFHDAETDIVETTHATVSRGRDIPLKGMTAARQTSGERIALFATLPSTDAMVTASAMTIDVENVSGDRARWDAMLPSGALSVGEHTLRLWRYDPTDNRMVSIGNVHVTVE